MSKQCQYRIGVDWGSTSFRAYCFDDQLNLVDSIACAQGIKTVESQQFEATLFQLIGHWLSPGTKILLSGMITSRNGWVETPYIEIPAKLDNLLEDAQTRLVRGMELTFLPGLCQKHPRADVIRGEELQLIGATKKSSTTSVVMPGTHSKWATINNGTVTGFQTIMTGELFDVLLNQTLVGQLCEGQEFDEPLFAQGVRTGYQTTTLVSELFQCRSGVLLKELAATGAHSYLSGLLIGNEISEGLRSCNAAIDSNNQSSKIDIDAANGTASKASTPIILIGADALCKRYAAAFTILNMQFQQSKSETTPNAFASLLATIS